MEESFFGFDTSVPLYDDGGGGQLEEPSEEEYDALNDETFGCATNGDWEEDHENLVRLKENLIDRSEIAERDGKQMRQNDAVTYKPKKSVIDQYSDSDLEINLSEMKLDDMKVDDSYNLGNGDDILLDPSVWSPGATKAKTPPYNGMYVNGSDSKNLAYINNYQNMYPYPMMKKPSYTDNENVAPFKHPNMPGPALNICTLEDVEKNIIKYQEESEKKNQVNSRSATPSQKKCINTQKQQPIYPNFSNQFVQKPLDYPPGFFPNVQQHLQQQQHHHQQQQQQQQQHQQQIRLRHDNILTQMNSNTPQLPKPNPLNLPPVNPYLVMPPKPNFPPLEAGGPLPMMLNQPFNKNFNFMPPPNPMSSPHVPIALNNFAMHPNFAAMRATALNAGMHGPPFLTHPAALHRFPNQMHPQLLANPQQSPALVNVFNTRLMQEIQQNHPLLQAQMKHHQQMLQTMQHLQPKVMHNNTTAGRQTLNANGNLPVEEVDDYANLMSTRDKHWLIGIQLSQLNSDTPYIDDYYYTVYNERKVLMGGTKSHSKAHKDNQLNHPLTQPKGNAQLVMVQLGNKNGTRTMNQRERRTSECSEQRAQYTYGNYKFENSLGKLQFGSVNAPRKLIDAEVMNGDSASKNNNNMNKLSSLQSKPILDVYNTITSLNKGNLTTQRRTRDTLLHIETLFQVVLKLEDLNNPIIMETILTKKKKEAERLAVLEQMEIASREEGPGNALNPTLRNVFVYEIESKEALLEKLGAGLSDDKIAPMMSVRKGKILLNRIMPHIVNTKICWSLWAGIFKAMRVILKRDRDDAEGVIYALYPVFKKHICTANFDTIVELVDAISFEENKSYVIFCSKFVMSALVALIMRVEEIYDTEGSKKLKKENEEIWKEFLHKTASSLENNIENETIFATIEPQAIQPIINHFSRFKDLNLNALSNFIKEAKEQIN